MRLTRKLKCLRQKRKEREKKRRLSNKSSKKIIRIKIMMKTLSFTGTS